MMASVTSAAFPKSSAQILTGNQVMEKVFFLSESDWQKACEANKYDIVIIGSGFCGYAVAEHALKKDPHCRVLIIEQGPFFLPDHFQNLPSSFTNPAVSFNSETLPWAVSGKTASGEAGTIRWLHGMYPFFGGRSITWSAWCPRPTKEEMHGWPEQTKTIIHEYFSSAEKLMHVQDVGELDAHKNHFSQGLASNTRSVYGALQHTIQKRLTNLKDFLLMDGIYRTEPARIACQTTDVKGIEKFAVPGELLSLVARQAKLHEKRNGAPLDIITECIAKNVQQQDGTAVALETSKGTLPLGQAKLVLAMGTLPATTLARNSFPLAVHAGMCFSGHFLSSIIARVPQDDLEDSEEFRDLELGACYIAGKKGDFSQQYHIQMSIFSDKHPQRNAALVRRYMPDVMSTASIAQLESSTDHVVFACSVVGELDSNNPETWFKVNAEDDDLTTNSILQVTESEKDTETWDVMDDIAFNVLEALSPNGAKNTQYWHGSPEQGEWCSERPSKEKRRVDSLVHESSTLPIGEDETSLVDLNYKLRGTSNVYVTGGALWPRGGSWNPTMPMVALAQHLADQLVNDLQSS